MLKNRTMSDAVTYLLYAVLIIALALVGRYVGEMYKYPGTGTVIGGLAGVGLSYWHYSTHPSATA